MIFTTTILSAMLLYARKLSSKVNPSKHALFSSIQDVNYENFDFVITKQHSKSKARLAVITTPHGKVECPNFVFCGTKAAMKGVTPDQLRAEGSQIMLSNTYHLLLTPGPDIVAKMGGLQKFTQWKGPMLTDSGGYQIFSMGFGSVSNEIKGKRGAESTLAWNQSLIKIDEQGATFRSYIDGSIHNLTPELSISCQQKLGADLIVVLDECTPFNVDKAYTEASMHRSHRWATRSLEEFLRLGCVGTQALYGIIQGGVYEDLRRVSCEYVNTTPFFGIAIGGSLGATKNDMYEIVRFTRQQCRDDRPIHLLGIGGVRDIFHGVRLGIDTFDCVHPTRLGRHGGALVMAAHWDEPQWLDGENDSFSSDNHESNESSSGGLSSTHPMAIAKQIKEEKKAKMRANNLKAEMKKKYYSLQQQQRLAEAQLESASETEVERHPQQQSQQLLENQSDSNNNSNSNNPLYNKKKTIKKFPSLQSADNNNNNNNNSNNNNNNNSNNSYNIVYSNNNNNNSKHRRVVREHIHLDKSSMRMDPRPIDSTCQCYTCRHFTRAYLHHLFRAKELIGATLVTIHNIHFMNRMMRDIRTGIETDTLDEVEKLYIHPDLHLIAATTDDTNATRDMDTTPAADL